MHSLDAPFTSFVEAAARPERSGATRRAPNGVARRGASAPAPRERAHATP
jgi:hypothetical protein